jgi:hypothetical protein
MFATVFRRLVAAFLVLHGCLGTAQAQVEEILHLQKTDGVSSAFSQVMPSRITLFSPDTDADTMIKGIVRASGLVPNFIVRAGGVNNALAVVRGERRYIIYNQYFLHELAQKTGNRWASLSVLAHEIGHHLNGHTLLGSITDRYRTELEADFYSGFVLQRMGATLEEARRAVELLGDPHGTTTHPARHDRLASVTNGWVNSCNNDPNCRNTPANLAGSSVNAPVSVLALRQPGEVPGAAPSGQPMLACGCWGFNPPPVMREPRCQSARVRIEACSGSCPSGGLPYSYNCS